MAMGEGSNHGGQQRRQHQSEPDITAVPSEESPLLHMGREPYTSLTSSQKRLLTILIGLATITSPLTATIYFPLLPLLRSHFKTSSEAINLTITLYVVFQAISPAVFGPLSDTLGRRPIYLATLLLYTAANLGLAVNNDSYAALLTLRALQSLGASAAYAVSYGVVADVCVPAERGSMVGSVSMALNLGTIVGPVIGGWVAYRSGGYGLVFWFLVIIGGLLLLLVLLFLPETARTLVGNRSSHKELWWQRPWWNLLRDCIRPQTQIWDSVISVTKPSDGQEPSDDRNKTLGIQHPLNCFRIIFYKDSFLVLSMHGLFYMIDYCVQTTIPSTYKDIYHFNAFEIGLAYLPRGFGIVAGGYFVGKWMDHNYKITAHRIGHHVDRIRGDSLDHFPIERARSRGTWWLLFISTCALTGYGWAIDKHGHVSITLILQFVLGFLGTCFYTIYNTLLVDIWPQSPSTAAAAASVVRCALAASGVAIVQPLIDAMGKAWYFTALGFMSGIAGSMLVTLLQTRGMNWRQRRLANTKGIHPAQGDDL
ncbi:hypothetical protein IMSHALPRED_008275 [Imshaugia aleurites]|uniref:Major facilitator superfamily (MFS) profile domain-containing protein n=1 Tax=Imshaugia aleurites TaxID=172621 RepID=A0A8H3IX99_9LECA|nr:hypothetical protein IMSHALPRED_008275 [Imshaugia aleurites]